MPNPIMNVTCTGEPWKGYREWEFTDEQGKTHRAIPGKSTGMKIGDKGYLEYQKGSNYGLWFFIKES